jgi:hypothetical protein
MESLIRNMLLMFGVLFIIDFITEYPKTFDNIDETVDVIKAKIGDK